MELRRALRRPALALALVFMALIAARAAGSRKLLQEAPQEAPALPEPVFYFPLTEDNLVSSIPPAEYQGIPSPGLVWTADPTFGSVISCNQEDQSYVTFPRVTFAQNGAFAVAFWVKPKPLAGTNLDYAFSHASDTFPEGSQVHVYIPETSHVDAGAFRSIVRDESDPPEGPAGPTYLDSNGCVSDPGCAKSASTPPHAPLDDGQWHLVVLSTHPEGGKGTDLYIDGTFAGSMVEGEEYGGPEGGIFATGGQDMVLNGTMHLCSRVDEDPDRFFTGSVAQLRIYNDPLDGAQVKALYDSEPASSVAATPLGAVPAASEREYLPPLTPGADGAVARINGQPACSVEPIPDLATVPTCGEGYVCAPLSTQQVAAFLGSATAQSIPPGTGLGVCAYSTQDILLPPPEEVPPAMAFFPLSSQSLESFPLGEYKGINDGATVFSDPIFGGALRCRSDDNNLVALDPVLYGASTGAFTINIWVRPDDQSGDLFSYVVSHKGTDPASSAQANTGWGPNQVQLYLPQEDHPSFGVARGYVRDGDDAYTGGPEAEGYIDSDGQVGYSGERSPDNPIRKGDWHMLTLTSQPDGSKGYVMYHDGVQVAGINETVPIYAAEGGVRLNVDGGDPMQLSGNIILCSRSDDPSERHFDGDLAYLSVWDESLTPQQVNALYTTVESKAVTAPISTGIEREAPALSTRQPESSTERFSTDGRPCQFPAVYNGQVITDCVYIAGVPMCQVEEDAWEMCDMPLPPAAKRSGGIATSALPYPYTSEEETGGNEEYTAQSGEAPTTRGELYSGDGQLCQLPLTYNGIVVDNYVGIGGEFFCWGVERDSWAMADSDYLSSSPDPGQLGLGAPAVPIYQLPRTSRVTFDSVACALPTVSEGEVIVDCVERNGQLSCPTTSGVWAACDDRSGASAGGLVVANRTTVAGEACLLPAVYNGYLWFDCAPATTPGSYGVSQVCPTADATWSTCRPVTQNTFSTKALDASETMDARTTPGTPGTLCPVEKSSNEQSNCESGLTCVPIPPLEGVSTSSNSSEAPLSGSGFCTRRPAGTTFGIFPALESVKAPQPLAYFPLTGGNLDSLTLPAFAGTSLGGADLAWAEDAMFGNVPVCSRAAQNAIELDNVPYGVSGAFAVNLWMRRPPGADTSGVTFQYLYSHTGIAGTSGYSPNQVAIYVADSGHPSYGSVRAIVKDSNDIPRDLTFLDSDGLVNSNANRTESGEKFPHADVNDGQWHMVTVSTLLDDSNGFAMYIDGELVGELQQSMQLNNGSYVVPTGGDPALMGDDIFLCARSDLSPIAENDRYYDGALANLMLFDSALSSEQISTMYHTYNPQAYSSSSEGESPADAPVVSSTFGPESQLSAKDSGEYSAAAASGGDEGLSTGAMVGISFGVMAGLALIGAGVYAASGARHKRQAAGRFEKFQDNYGGGGGGARGTAGYIPGDATIQLSTNGSSKLAKMDSGYSAGLPASPGSATSAGSGNPFAASPSARQQPAGPGSTTSFSTMTDDVEIDPGKRSLFKKPSARIVVPEDLQP